MLISLALSLLVMWVIGWQASMKAFPFCDWRVRKPQGPWDVINCVFALWNLWSFVTTWMALGMITLPAILYALGMLLALWAGWNWIEAKSIYQTGKTMGWRYVLTDYKDKIARWFKRK